MTSLKRSLTLLELNDVLSPLKNLNELLLGKLTSSLKNIQIYPNKIPKLKDEIERRYLKSKIQPNEMVGINAALCISQPTTQMVLQTFHLSGVLNLLTTSGVKRMEELLSLTKNQKLNKTLLYFKDVNNSEENLEKLFKLSKKIEYTNISTFISEYDIFEKSEHKIEWWNNCSLPYTHVCRLTINKNKCIEHSIFVSYIAKECKNIKNDMIVKYNNNYIDICFNLPKQLDDTNYNDNSKRFIRFFYEENIKTNYISGTEGILQTYFALIKNVSNNMDEWVVETKGTNFKELLTNPILDYTRILTNNVWEIYNSLGIEATRTFLINEFKSVLSGSAFVDPRHLLLLVDTICFTGLPKAVSRHGIVGGPLAKMSFEESIKNALSSSIRGETDNMKGSSGCVMLGKKLYSNFELVLDTTKLHIEKPMAKFTLPNCCLPLGFTSIQIKNNKNNNDKIDDNVENIIDDNNILINDDDNELEDIDPNQINDMYDF